MKGQMPNPSANYRGVLEHFASDCFPLAALSIEGPMVAGSLHCCWNPSVVTAWVLFSNRARPVRASPQLIAIVGVQIGLKFVKFLCDDSIFCNKQSFEK